MAGWSPGDQVGRYVLRSPLGTGSFAVVWLAEEIGGHGFRKKVALKLLRQEEDPRRIAELLMEARVVANLQHPNIVAVHRVSDDPVFHMSMDYVDGGTLLALTEHLSAAGLRTPASIAARMGLDILKGLQAAHEAVGPGGRAEGVIHRDLKPANILIDSTGFLKVADFGLAKVAGEATATATGSLKGTPSYVAPEIWKGGREFGPPVDLFAVGCILWELATGRRLLDGNSVPELFARAAMGNAEEDAEALIEWGEPFASFIQRLIERDPAVRYQDCASAIRDLSALQARLDAPADLETFLVLAKGLNEQSSPGDPSRPPRVRPTSDPDWIALIERSEVTPIEVAVGRDVSSMPEAPSAAGRTPVGPRVAAAGAALLAIAVVLGVGLAVTQPPPNEVVAAKAPRLPEDLAVPAPTTRRAPERRAEPTPSVRNASSPNTTETREAVHRPPEARPPKPEPAESPTISEPSPQPSNAGTSTPQEHDVGCLILVSRPAGGRVWIDGREQSARALSRPTRGIELPPGTYRVAMGPGMEPIAETEILLAAGVSTQVQCRLGAGGTCRGTLASSSACW